MLWYLPTLANYLSTRTARLLLSTPIVLLFAACQQVGLVPETQPSSFDPQPEQQQVLIDNKAPELPQATAEPAAIKAPLVISKVSDTVELKQPPAPATPVANILPKDIAQVQTDDQLNSLQDTAPAPAPETETETLAAAEPETLEAADTETAAKHTALSVLPTEAAVTEPKVTVATEQSTKLTTATIDSKSLIPEIATPPQPAPVLDLWQLTVASYGLYKPSNKRIDTHDAWYRKHTEYMLRVTKRSSRYYHYVLNQVLAADMPAEIALLPIVESAYQPFAHSPSRASGIWQFIPSTGKRYGLKQNWWYDGRRDIVAQQMRHLIT